MAPLTRFWSEQGDLHTKDAEGGAVPKLGRNISPRRKGKQVKTEDLGMNLHLKEFVDLSDDDEGEKCGRSNVPAQKIQFMDLSDDEEGPCSVPLPKIQFVELSDDEGVENCGICYLPPSELYFVTLCNCRHVFCSGCVKDHYRSMIDSQMSELELIAEDVLQKLPCPNEGCKEEVKRVELVDIVGLRAVQKYETWLNSVFDLFYGPSVKEANSLPVILSGRGRDACVGKQRYEIYKCLAVLEEALGDFTQAKQNSNKKGKRLLELDKAIGDFTQATQNPSKKGKYLVDPTLEEAGEDFGFTQAMLNSTPALQPAGVPPHYTAGFPPYYNAGGFPTHLVPSIYSAGIPPSFVPTMYSTGTPPLSLVPTPISMVPPIYIGGASPYTNWADETGSGKKAVRANGTGFGGNPYETTYAMNTKLASAKRTELEFDKKVEKQMASLTKVLNRNAADKRDKRKRRPELTVASFVLIMRNNILSLTLQQLVQNDSILDISERSSLYSRMACLMGVMATHTELLPVLIGHTSQVAPNKGKAHAPPQEIAEDKNSTIFDKLGNIYRQAKVMLQNLAQHEPDRGGKRKQKTEKTHAETSLAEELCRCYENLEQAVSMLTSPAVAQSRGSTFRSRRKAKGEASSIGSTSNQSPAAEPSVANYKEVLKQMQFRQLAITNEKGEYAHFFKDDISGKVSSSAIIDKGGVHNHKRINHIAKEVASLATNLPLEWESSIHLCVDTTRIDVMRALIIGPQGTPYQNGLFLFDIFLPPDYPMSPPRVHLLTTGGGQVRFNPNLYNTGHICLSLLGTWSGPGWVGGKSTLLQVLVSIQSLIFVKDPYYNEPGREHGTSAAAAERDNRRLRQHTLSYAVLAALKNPDPQFADLTREHFRFKRTEVEKQCDEWVAAEARGQAKQKIDSIVQDVKQELQKLYS